MLSVDAALDAIMAMARPTHAEDVAIPDAMGRTLAAPMVAARTQPRADLSAMDGYAMRQSDGGGPWQLGSDPAQHDGYGTSFQPGSAVRIFTGAALPKGADAILMQEQAKIDGAILSARDGALPDPKFVRKRGMDFRAGDMLHPAGTLLGARHIAVAIAAGLTKVSVHKRPVVAIISTGNELCLPSDMAEHLPDANGPMLAALVRQWGGVAQRVPPIADVQTLLVSALENARASDIVVTSGGTSVGDHDLLIPALESLGAQIIFWKVAVQPGKPLVVARLGTAIVLGLPGNPVSAFVTATLFLKPLMARLVTANSKTALSRAPLAHNVPANGPREQYLRATLDNGAVTALPDQDSGLTLAMSQADCLIRRHPHCDAAKRGDLVDIVRI